MRLLLVISTESYYYLNLHHGLGKYSFLIGQQVCIQRVNAHVVQLKFNHRLKFLISKTFAYLTLSSFLLWLTADCERYWNYLLSWQQQTFALLPLDFECKAFIINLGMFLFCNVCKWPWYKQDNQLIGLRERSRRGAENHLRQVCWLYLHDTVRLCSAKQIQHVLSHALQEYNPDLTHSITKKEKLKKGSDGIMLMNVTTGVEQAQAGDGGR